MKRRKFHFVPAAAKHVVHRDADLAEDHRDLVHEGDVDIALRVLDHLGGFGRFDIARAERTAAGDEPVEPREQIGDFRRLPGDDLGDAIDRVFAIAGIDTFRAVTQEKIDAGFEARFLFEGRPRDVFRDTGIDGRFEDRRPRPCA